MRAKIDFNKGWRFHKGDILNENPNYKGNSYLSGKVERYHIGPACKNYNSTVDCWDNEIEHKGEIWSSVDLPHDYVVEELPEEKYNNALGFMPYENAWYVKKFYLGNEDRNKRICLFFEGVATHTTVYVNGCLLKHNFCGYTSFEVDITDVVRFDYKNTVSVYVETNEHEGWWYSGGGIYRNVWLIKTDLISVDLWGIYAKPVLQSNGKWTVETEITVRNDDEKNENICVETVIFNQAGNTVAQKRINGAVGYKDKALFKTEIAVENPALWSPDTPVLYEMTARIYRNGAEVDEYKTKFGFRTFTLDADKGLFINGKHYKIKGVCGHGDCGLLGKAVSDNVYRHKIRLLKEMGANGYRTSHYMQAEATMDALDENGFIVMDETRWFESSDESKEQLSALIKRDRNRPSVFFWSIGNEEYYFTNEQGRRICRSMMAVIRKLDDRPITVAACFDIDKCTVYQDLDVIGFNYRWEKIGTVHKQFPNKPILSSENTAQQTTRGWYFDCDEKRSFFPAYDREEALAVEGLGRELTWKTIMEREWILGGYQWIAFEHRGEATWPRLCSQSGAIDLYMQKKDAFYQNQSLWTDLEEKPMVHLLPHWNFKGLEGVLIKVHVYSNAPKVELFLNGQSLGLQEIGKYGHGDWRVPYEQGKLEVKAYDDMGNLVASDCKVTPDKAYKLMLSLDNADDLQANGKDVALFSCYVVDKDGNEVPDAEPTVKITALGLGKLYSTGSDITDHTSLLSPERKMRAGRMGIAVKMKDGKGKLEVMAFADGLISASFVKQF